jgi:hypothetical protein
MEIYSTGERRLRIDTQRGQGSDDRQLVAAAARDPMEG